jgi:hypothetical protein
MSCFPSVCSVLSEVQSNLQSTIIIKHAPTIQQQQLRSHSKEGDRRRFVNEQNGSAEEAFNEPRAFRAHSIIAPAATNNDERMNERTNPAYSSQQQAPDQ